MLDIAALQDNGASLNMMSTHTHGHMAGRTYHLGTTNFQDLAISCAQRSLSTDHGGTVTEHSDTDKGIAVCMPIHDGLVVLPGASCNTFVGLGQLFVHESLELFNLLRLGLSGDVDVSNLEVHLRHQLNTSNL